MDSAGMQSAQSGAAHQGSSEAMEEDEKQLAPCVGGELPDIGTLYRGEEGLGAALTDQAPAAETRSRALTSEG